MLLTIWLPCHCALSPFQCLLLLIANGTQVSLRKNYLLWDHNAWLHLCLGGQQCLSSNKHLRNKQLWYRAQKSGMENSYLQKNTELSPSGFIILPKSWEDLPSDFRVSNSHLLIYFCLLEFLNNFVDMCPNSCTLCHLNSYETFASLSQLHLTAATTISSLLITAQLFSSARYHQQPPRFIRDQGWPRYMK